MSKNKNLRNAKKTKNDEFYTRLTDIEKELRHYKKHFKGKVVYCNCDDPKISNFFKYFSYNFHQLGLKKLVAMCYKNNDPDKRTKGLSDQAIKIEYEGELNKDGTLTDCDQLKITKLEGNGDFRSEESIEILQKSDIVVTNPPFSLFREYVAQLMEYQKQFLIIGNHNAITYKEVFPIIKENKMWLGVSPRSMQFVTPEKEEKSVNACWYTNLDHKKRHEDIILFKKYNKKDYPKYDNYDAIEVGKVADIPKDYEGVMGVPITFLNKYNPDQFEILGSRRWAKSKTLLSAYTGESKPPESDKKTTINGRETYDRIFIKRKRCVIV